MEFEMVEIYQMFNKNVIELAQAKWTSTIVFEPKKDVILRFWFDCQKLNM